MATWPSGKAEACKAFTTGSNPVLASTDYSAWAFRPGFLFLVDSYADEYGIIGNIDRIDI